MEAKNVAFLRGRHVSLRPLAKSDLPLVLRWINDPEVRRFVLRAFPATETEETVWLARTFEGQPADIALGICLARTGELIGTMGLHRIDWIHRTAATGTLIGEEKYRNRGLGTEAKMLLLAYAFLTLNLRKVTSGAFAFNRRSQRYSLKCGYKVEGVRRKQFFKRGRYCDEVILAVFREDWLKLWRKFRRTLPKGAY